MNSENSPLLTLIKLHEGTLSAATGIAVREQLASDANLRLQWKTVSNIYDNKPKLEQIELLENELFNPNSIAAFLEQNMNGDQQTEFEQFCLENPAALREVISAFDIDQANKIPDELSHLPAKLTKTSAPYFEQPQSMALNSIYLQEIKEPIDAIEANREIEPLSRLPLPIKARSKRNSSPRKKKGKPAQQRWLIVAAAIILVAIAIPALQSYLKNNLSIHPPIVENPVDVPKKLPPNLEQNKSIDPDSDTTIVNKPDDIGSQNKILSDTPNQNPPSMDNNHEPKIVKADAPCDLQIIWTQLSGLAGYKTINSVAWQGVLSQKQSNRIEVPVGSLGMTTAKKEMQLRTLPASWLQGQIQAGPKFVVDAESEIQLTVSETQKIEKDSQRTQRAIIQLELYSGKVAFSQLQRGDIVRYRDQLQEWKMTVSQDQTSIAIIQATKSPRQILVLTGEVQLKNKAAKTALVISSNQSVTQNKNTFSEPVVFRKKQNWVSQAGSPLKMSLPLLAQLNESENLLAALARVPATTTGEQAKLSTHLGFSLDAISAVPRAAVSKHEIHRTAAIEWLLASGEDQAHTEVWQKINSRFNTNDTKLSIRNWFLASQGKIPSTAKILSEISNGLAARQSLFVRQCSIHFLRQITQKPLAEYNPSKPTRAAIDAVRQKTRRATSNNNRPRR